MADKITNKSIRERMGQENMESIIRKRRLWWLGYVWCIDKDKRSQPDVACIGFLREGREEEDHGRTGQRPL